MYMSSQQWSVILCPTEADLVTANRLLVYHVPDVLSSLGLSKSQLTASGVVSKNDYDSNIASLSPESNYKIIKALDGKVDAATIVEHYKASQQVIQKNTRQDPFSASQRVFIDHQQTLVQTGPSSPSIRALCVRNLQLSARMLSSSLCF
ncbi:MAG: hypothetical protein J3Q66DRAFT_365187 [Benniella sp.]|nr:MAG: hypothetical protein J3Q66DRAFT_365187 [Benniella sp.]